ncbi:ABC transporter ATP-binding protein [Flavivirga rizhaonensis]|uniref:ABC transporter ATP-binding protein n=1 Tax=Flavivirga rizhaonensis TaxID=2559571 RepID=A0A4S1E2S2_9FLAO|nr:ABC transporter ATP-binding protein [Flavivirga rizhaonensis]TGV04705.1 ABC transporter ATP-binding protein [Flavivirga rizhaonensis]
MITLQNIEKTYFTKTIETLALSNISINIDKGEFLSIMGPSGCGKSTLLNVIGLLDKPSKGAYMLDNMDVSALSNNQQAQIRNQKIGFIFQSFHLIPDIPVIDNVELPLLYRKGVNGKERRERAITALEKVGLSARMKHYPTQLSGGQSQRVAIARAIIGEPQIILADEPTGNLDSAMGNEILGILKTLNETENTTVIMVTHDEKQAERTDRIIRLFDGSQVD